MSDHGQALLGVAGVVVVAPAAAGLTFGGSETSQLMQEGSSADLEGRLLIADSKIDTTSVDLAEDLPVRLVRWHIWDAGCWHVVHLC